MNAPIARLFVVFVVLFALLIGFTSNWTVFGAEGLQHNPQNRRELLEAQRIRRGDIRAADGTILARSVHQSAGTYSRRYPLDGLFSQALGYSYTTLGRSGLERSYDDELTGRNNELGSLFERLTGTDREGADLRTTLDPAAQRLALQLLGDRKGAVVALDPTSGAVKVMASVPGFDPNDLRSATRFRALRRDTDAPLLNRVTQSGYPPGSTFKVVTAIAAIDSGRYTPQTRISGRNNKVISGVPLRNFGNEEFGNITLTDALTHSVNTVFGEVGEKLGKQTMRTYMERLGFDEPVAIDLPADQRAASGERSNGVIISPTSGSVDVGRMAIGQDKLTVTPLQMAMVAATVANGGRLMQPHLADRAIDADGRTVKRVGAHEIRRVMSERSALQVGQMMTKVVEEGTGTASALQGISVGGKTGTAEVDRSCGPNQAWFIAFAPAAQPRVAIAVTIECTEGTGGTVAAPIAKAVMESLLR